MRMPTRLNPDHLKLSVILPCYNGAATIAVQMEALTRQHWPNGWEVVVVNNGSTDRSMEIVEEFRDRLPELKIVEAYVPGTTRLGVPHSYNTGIKAATGEAFVFCEADDEVATGWLAAMGSALTEHDFVAARIDHRKLNVEWLHPLEGEGYQSAGLSQLDCYPHLPHASGCSFGMRRSLYEQVGALSTVFPCVHDTEYCWRLQQAGYALHFEPKALVYYREKSNFKARFRQAQNWGRDFIRLTQHYGSPPGRFALLRELIAVVRSLPSGIWAALLSTFRQTGGKASLAEWIWAFGWATGKLQTILQNSAQPQRKKLAVATVADQTTFGGIS
jgi:glycosyltransferase involved in cell wall biosynthesis